MDKDKETEWMIACLHIFLRTDFPRAIKPYLSIGHHPRYWGKLHGM